MEYQSIKNCGKVTIDNIRRSLSDFFSWLEEEDRLTKSGVELRLQEIGKKLGVEKGHPHKFRRTMATRI